MQTGLEKPRFITRMFPIHDRAAWRSDVTLGDVGEVLFFPPVNLRLSVVRQKSDKTLPVSDVLTSSLSSAGDRYGTTNTQNGS